MNILLYKPTLDKVEKLFENRILITSIETHYFKDDILTVFLCTENDNNANGRIDGNDFKSLYVYSLKAEKMREISEQNATIISYFFIEGSQDVLVKFGVDRNKDGKYEHRWEPCEIKKYDFEEERLVNIVPASLNEVLQKQLDGVTK